MKIPRFFVPGKEDFVRFELHLKSKHYATQVNETSVLGGHCGWKQNTVSKYPIMAKMFSTSGGLKLPVLKQKKNRMREEQLQ